MLGLVQMKIESLTLAEQCFVYLPVADGISHVDVSIHAALNELHVILRQGPCLVREHILHLPAPTTLLSYSFQPLLSSLLLAHLAQLLVQIRSVDHSPLAQLLVHHLVIPHDEVGAQELLHLHRDIHGDGNDIVEEDHEGQEVREGSDHLRNRRCVNIAAQSFVWHLKNCPTHDVSLSLRFCPLVVPRLVSVGVGLPDVFQHGVNEGLAN